MKSCAVMLLTVGIAMAASAQDVDIFLNFPLEGVMDPGVSSAAANSLVSEGIASKDPEVVDMTIRNLGNFASTLVHDLPNPYGTLPSRSFPMVPGLKEFLIEHWREQHEKVGRDTMQAIMDDLGFESPDGFTIVPSAGSHLPEEDEAGEQIISSALVAELDQRLPVWPMVPQILSVFWPGDPEVEQFLYEVRDTDGSRHIVMSTLGLLNTGKFISEAANTFRMSQLVETEIDMDPPTAVIWAAEGLALSRPTDALPALIEAGVKYPGARGAVMVAVAGYNESQLELYAREIDELVQGGINPMPTGAETEAFDKLVRQVKLVRE